MIKPHSINSVVLLRTVTANVDVKRPRIEYTTVW